VAETAATAARVAEAAATVAMAAVAAAEATDKTSSPVFAFLAKTRPKSHFGNSRAFQPPKINILIFLVTFVRMYIFDALSLII
jgi:hypothetical protein